MKRYIIFTFDTYYPNGGWSDFRQAYDSLEECEIWIRNVNGIIDSYQIIDLEEGKIIVDNGILIETNNEEDSSE